MNTSTRSAGRTIGVALRATVLATLVLGVGYTFAITGIAQLVSPDQAHGSIVRTDGGEPVGSALLGQTFSDADGAPLSQYFQSRPSAAGDGYDGGASSGSNLGPNNPDLVTAIRERRAQVAAFNGVSTDAVPADAVTASGSGLDPHISPAYAAIQVERVAEARGMSVAEVERIVADHTSGRELGFLGEPRVNVVELNVALEGMGD